jgi:uncharacterized coiled-coil protein SlyX
LLEARDAIRNHKQRLQKQEDALINLSNQLNELAQQVSARISNIEARVHQLEVRVAANEDLDQIVTAWAAGTNLCPVTLGCASSFISAGSVQQFCDYI